MVYRNNSLLRCVRDSDVNEGEMDRKTEIKTDRETKTDREGAVSLEKYA